MSNSNDYKSIGNILSMDKYMYVREEQTSGTNGGTSSTTTTVTRTLNTVKVNTISGASLTSNQVTLPAGTYYIKGSCPAYKSLGIKAFIENITDTTTELVGQSCYCPLTEAGMYIAPVIGKITLAATKIIALQLYTQGGYATYGLGNTVNSGDVEVFSELEIWKLD